MNVALLSLGLVFLFLLIAPCGSLCSTDLCDSYTPEFESVKRFPHFVTITRNSYGTYDCSGSIIASEWILTALNCVQYGRFTVHFLLEHFYNSRNSFSLSLDQAAVIPYPTGYDNIALIKLPISLEFSELLKPIRYYTWNEGYHEINSGFAVMPGFNLQQSSQLTYGMYRVLCQQDCKYSFGSLYDEFMEVCTTDWSRSNQLTSSGIEGSGLIQGWPRDPHLIGIYSGSVHNKWKSGQIFVKLSKYTRWIDAVIMGFYYTTTTPNTTTIITTTPSTTSTSTTTTSYPITTTTTTTSTTSTTTPSTTTTTPTTTTSTTTPLTTTTTTPSTTTTTTTTTPPTPSTTTTSTTTTTTTPSTTTSTTTTPSTTTSTTTPSTTTTTTTPSTTTSTTTPSTTTTTTTPSTTTKATTTTTKSTTKTTSGTPFPTMPTPPSG